MRAIRAALALTLLLVPVPTPPRAARAEEEPLPGAVSKADARHLSAKLRSRAVDWWSHRKRLVVRCPQCKGGGKVRWRQGRRRVLVACPKCDGHKLHVDKDQYRTCFYDRRSPAFRRQKGIRARLTEEFVAAREGRPFPEIVKSYAIKELELVDGAHGVVHVAENKDSVARPQRWIWAREAGKNATWYLYDPEADGPWPSEDAASRQPSDRDVETTPREPVPELPNPDPEPPEADPIPPPEPPVPEPSPDAADRVSYGDSKKLVATWIEERNDMAARVVRIELGLEDVEGHEEKVANARTFIGDIRRWLEEERPAFERARGDVSEKETGVLLADRITINTIHFKAYRRLELVEKMLIGVLPDLRD